MFELHTPLAPRRPIPFVALDAARHEAGLSSNWLMGMLDEVDYGMLLIDGERHLVHANKAARRDLVAEHPLQLLGQALRARLAHDVVPLHNALQDAAQLGRRRLLRLGDAATRCNVAVVPLVEGPDGMRPVLLVLGRQQVCEELSVDSYARAHALTLAETQVLKGLAGGLTPQKVAQRHQVALSTVRTQIGSIRAKTGSASIRALLTQVAQLPPMVSALQSGRPAA